MLDSVEQWTSLHQCVRWAVGPSDLVDRVHGNSNLGIRVVEESEVTPLRPAMPRYAPRRFATPRPGASRRLASPLIAPRCHATTVLRYAPHRSAPPRIAPQRPYIWHRIVTPCTASPRRASPRLYPSLRDVTPRIAPLCHDHVRRPALLRNAAQRHATTRNER